MWHQMRIKLTKKTINFPSMLNISTGMSPSTAYSYIYSLPRGLNSCKFHIDTKRVGVQSQVEIFVVVVLSRTSRPLLFCKFCVIQSPNTPFYLAQLEPYKAKLINYRYSHADYLYPRYALYFALSYKNFSWSSSSCEVLVSEPVSHTVTSM